MSCHHGLLFHPISDFRIVLEPIVIIANLVSADSEPGIALWLTCIISLNLDDDPMR